MKCLMVAAMIMSTYFSGITYFVSPLVPRSVSSTPDVFDNTKEDHFENGPGTDGAASKHEERTAQGLQHFVHIATQN
nr:hypothetical protein CFP56_70013 [Quercus suber]